jgi:NAD-dependent dihydropyrimidine dehydrogenase PreA subunit
MKAALKLDYYRGQTGEFIEVRPERCTGCGLCARFCPRGVWVREGEIYRPRNLARCAECGACWNVCAADAVDFGEPRGGTGVRFLYG